MASKSNLQLLQELKGYNNFPHAPTARQGTINPTYFLLTNFLIDINFWHKSGIDIVNTFVMYRILPVVGQRYNQVIIHTKHLLCNTL